MPNPIEHPDDVATAVWCQEVEVEDPTELRPMRKCAVEAACRPSPILVATDPYPHITYRGMTAHSVACSWLILISTRG